MNRKVRIDRLTKLLYMLNNHNKIFPKMVWDLSQWSDACDAEHATCGSSACALGSAACYPPFKKSGLKLQAHSISIPRLVPIYKDVRQFGAGALFFGLTGAESEFLFDPSAYKDENGRDRVVEGITAADVAKRVAVLLKHYKKKTEPALEGYWFYEAEKYLQYRSL